MVTIAPTPAVALAAKKTIIDEAHCDIVVSKPWGVYTASKDQLSRHNIVEAASEYGRDVAKMQNIVEADSAMPQNSVEAIDGREALVEQGQREEAARRRTLILANFPYHTTEHQISAAVDAAAGTQDCISRCCIVHGSDGKSAGYGLFEFKDTCSASDAFDASRRGQLIIDDESGHTWHLRARHCTRRRRSQATGS